MRDYLKDGMILYHKYIIGEMKIISYDADIINVSTQNNGNLPFVYRDFGKCLYLRDKDKLMKPFDSEDDYLDYVKSDNLRIAKLKEEKKLIEDARKAETIQSKQNNNAQKINKQKTMKKPNIGKETVTRKGLLELLNTNYNFKGFLHYTDLTNLVNIIKEGNLYSRNKAINKGFADAADQDVIKRTSGNIFNYVRFYYKEKTPTFYNNEGIKIDNKKPHMPIPVALLFRDEIIFHDSVAFLSGCGGSGNSEFTEDISKAYKFDWNTIFSRGPIPDNKGAIEAFGYDKPKSNIINKRNAEFLYRDSLDIQYLKKIIFRSKAAMKTAKELIGEKYVFDMVFDRRKFNCKNNYLEDYTIMKKGNQFEFTVCFHSNPERYFHNIKLIYSDGEYKNIEINSLGEFRKSSQKNYCYSFNITPDTDKYVSTIEYSMNNHLSAIWKDK